MDLDYCHKCALALMEWNFFVFFGVFSWSWMQILLNIEKITHSGGLMSSQRMVSLPREIIGYVQASKPL
jgi:predicted metal-binding membrane protein